MVYHVYRRQNSLHILLYISCSDMDHLFPCPEQCRMNFYHVCGGRWTDMRMSCLWKVMVMKRSSINTFVMNLQLLLPWFMSIYAQKISILFTPQNAQWQLILFFKVHAHGLGSPMVIIQYIHNTCIQKTVQFANKSISLYKFMKLLS